MRAGQQRKTGIVPPGVPFLSNFLVGPFVELMADKIQKHVIGKRPGSIDGHFLIISEVLNMVCIWIVSLSNPDWPQSVVQGSFCDEIFVQVFVRMVFVDYNADLTMF
jgi:hypothetical protein